MESLPSNLAALPRVLWIDSDPATTRAASDVASRTIFTPEAHPAIALERLERGERFEAIFMDLHARHLSGPDFLRRARHVESAIGERVAFVAKATARELWSSVANLGRPAVTKPLIREALDAVLRSLAEAGPASPDPRSELRRSYPGRLSEEVKHAERFIVAIEAALDAILAGPSFDPTESSAGEVWLVGRGEEVSAFVGDVAGGWRRGVLTEDAAAEIVRRHLEEAHRGMVAHVGRAVPVACCVGLEAQVTRAAPVDYSPRAYDLAVVCGDTPSHV